MIHNKTEKAALEYIRDQIDITNNARYFISAEQEAIRQFAVARLEALGRIDEGWFSRMVEKVSDLAVESLRLGSYEARKEVIRNDWKIEHIREKRKKLKAEIIDSLAQLNQTKVPKKIQDEGMDAIESSFCTGWNSAVDAFFNGSKDEEPLVVTEYSDYPIRFTLKDGTEHEMSISFATQLLQKLYEEWPGGLEEIESCINTSLKGITDYKSRIVEAEIRLKATLDYWMDDTPDRSEMRIREVISVLTGEQRDIEEARKEFEEYSKRAQYDLDRDSTGAYTCSNTQIAWGIWFNSFIAARKKK